MGTIGTSSVASLINNHEANRLNHFHARYAPRGRKGTVHRVYVTEAELLFFDIGVKTFDVHLKERQVAQAWGGGMVPAVIARVAANMAQSEIDRWTRALDGADATRIREFVEGDSRSFVLQAKDIYDISVNPRRVMDLLFGAADCKAIVRMGHPDRGKMKLELLSIDDVALVIHEFPRLFGPAVQINVGWNSI